MNVRNNEYLRKAHEASIGKNINSGLCVLLKAWKEAVDGEFNRIMIHDYFNRLTEDNVEDFITYLKEADIGLFVVKADCIDPEALHILIGQEDIYIKAETYVSRWYSIALV